MARILNWSLLGLLLAALLAGAISLDRSTWPSLMGDEATYLMAAESLAWDQDLTYTRADYDRFVAHWDSPPEGLILQSDDQGFTMVYGKPPYYPLYLAPFVRLSPTRGAGIANAMLLALIACVVAVILGRKIGEAAPLWVAVFLFASVTFTYVFWAHADLFLMCLVALALSLVYSGGPPLREHLTEMYADMELEDPGRFALRWLAVGALLAVVALSRPFYGTLLLPACLAIPRNRRLPGLAALFGGTLFTCLILVGINHFVFGQWTSYGGERLGFYSRTGFPLVELSPDEWPQLVGQRGSGSWIEPEKRTPYSFDGRLTSYNLLYFAAGRSVGVLPYFLPLLLGFFAYRHERGRWSLLVAAGLAMACFLYVRPFNFYGGGASIGNRYFLPVYPAFWFLAVRRRPPWLPMLIAAAAALAIFPLWKDPLAFPRSADGGYRHVSPLARQYLPYETTQDHLKPSGAEDFTHHGLWIKPLGPEVRASGGEKGWITSRPGATVELLVGSSRALRGLELEVAEPGVARLGGLEGAALSEMLLAPSGRTAFDLLLGEPTARHRMWWSKDLFHLYRLRFELPPAALPSEVPVRFRLREETDLEILP